MKLSKRTDKPKFLRKADKIPGILYGHGIDSEAIQVDANEFIKTYHQYGKNMTFNVTLDKKKHLVFIKDIQKYYMNQAQVVHFDLQKVSIKDSIASKIPLSFINDPISGKGVVLSISLDELEVEYKVGSGVSSIEVDLSALSAGSPITVKDIITPKGFKVLDDPERIVASLASASTVILDEDTVEEEVTYDTGNKE